MTWIQLLTLADVCFLVAASRPAVLNTQPPIQWVTEKSLHGINLLERQAEHLPTSSTGDKICVSTYTPPYVLTLWYTWAHIRLFHARQLHSTGEMKVRFYYSGPPHNTINRNLFYVSRISIMLKFERTHTHWVPWTSVSAAFVLLTSRNSN
jgi:hypothetical protein